MSLNAARIIDRSLIIKFFKGHFDATEKGHKPGPPKYKVSIPEIAPAGYNVTTVTATDPDGLDSLLTYRIVGANDNFLINEK